jgi:voltage-gated sodium channel
MMQKLRTFLESARFTNFIIAVILLNAVTLGLETEPVRLATWQPTLKILDTIFLAIFTLGEANFLTEHF